MSIDIVFIISGLLFSFIIGHYIGFWKGRDHGLWEATSDAGLGRP